MKNKNIGPASAITAVKAEKRLRADGSGNAAQSMPSVITAGFGIMPKPGYCRQKTISKMKKILGAMLVLLLHAPFSMLACDICQDKQPNILKGITHGTGPQSDMDYVIIWSAVVIVSVTLFLSVRYLVKPEKSSPGHIKNIIVE